MRDRGSDYGYTNGRTNGRAVEKLAPRKISAAKWKKLLAIAMVAIMAAAAFAAVASIPMKPSSPAGDDENQPASTQAGEREVTYTVSNIGESYVKDSRDVDGARGIHGDTPGLSEWWTLRKAAYSDTIVHNGFPFYVAYNPESSYNSYGQASAHLTYGTYGFYRYSMLAKNLTNVATGPGFDPLFLPILAAGPNPQNLNGGNVSVNWYITYLTSADVTAVKAGTSYINSYYGVTPGAVNFGGVYANDGWYIEHKGLMTLDRLASKKFLNLDPLAADMRVAFTNANAGGALNTSWGAQYLADGSPGAAYDIIACYDYSINSGPVLYFLKLDPASTQDVLVLRMWGYSWGFEALMMRYLDTFGLVSKMIPWPEAWYFNATLTPTRTTIDSRMTAVYHMTTWKDTTWWGPAYLLEAQHNDYNDIDGAWLSRFTPYMAFRGYTPYRTQWEPGTNNIGTNVYFWQCPELWNLASTEKLVVKLGSGPHMGYIPYKGVVSDTFPKQGGGNDLKAAEMNTHQMWGELVLGKGIFPTSLYSATYYNHATKTLTITGPTSFTGQPDQVFPALYENGTPSIYMDVSKVSKYALSIQGGNPTAPGVYTLVVTAKNYSDVTVTDWNGTVNLAVTGAALGASTHAFVPADNGVWTTTLTISSYGHIEVSSADSIFSLDVTDLLSLDIIPEFPTLLLPVMAAAAMVVAIIRRREKKDA